MGPAERHMTYLSTELGSSVQDLALTRRRDPLLAKPDRSVLPTVIRRPAFVLAGRGSLPDILMFMKPLGPGGASA